MSGTSITARTAASEEIEKAFKEWNLCDHFCEFLYKFLKGFAKRKSMYLLLQLCRLAFTNAT
jgi:hypothetical protein